LLPAGSISGVLYADSNADGQRFDQSTQRDEAPLPKARVFLDKNGDGKLDPTEMAAARQAMQGQGFPGAGKGGPGMGKGPGGPGEGNGPGREAILKRFDKNGDGQLDETERAAARKAMEERGGGAGPGNGNGPGREEILKRFDKDGDGKLNEEERAAAMKAREERKN